MGLAGLLSEFDQQPNVSDHHAKCVLLRLQDNELISKRLAESESELLAAKQKTAEVGIFVVAHFCHPTNNASAKINLSSKGMECLYHARHWFRSFC